MSRRCCEPCCKPCCEPCFNPFGNTFGCGGFGGGFAGGNWCWIIIVLIILALICGKKDRHDFCD